ncbi:unnamed protein product [Protopolystoma xenopodis]|uniref:Uncharacterized protein n=1 Tax=Protopolystoma xenopodis TaxID=117903 RepID=A0A448WKX8_9PLAT|nr:unnamed protein product [Protopolystoma xenopodis]
MKGERGDEAQAAEVGRLVGWLGQLVRWVKNESCRPHPLAASFCPCLLKPAHTHTHKHTYRLASRLSSPLCVHARLHLADAIASPALFSCA